MTALTAFTLTWLFVSSVLGSRVIGQRTAEAILRFVYARRVRDLCDTASGEILDNLGKHYGVYRKIETDADYRSRLYKATNRYIPFPSERS